MPDKQRINYIEGYQFLQAEPVQDYSGFSNKLGATVGALFELMFSELAPEDYEQDIIQDIAQRTAGPASSKINLTTFEKSFSPITDVLEYSTPASGHRPLSFGHGISVISEDVAPYIRSIVAFDLRLEQERIQLSGPLSQGAKRPRTTRASRAAVEGGDKGMIRRERWFPMKLVPNQVMMTGGPSWENILLSQIQRGCVENTSETAEISESMSQCSNESMYKSAGEHVPVI